MSIHPAALDIPARWRTPRVVFVNSMSDLSVGEKFDSLHVYAVRERFLCAQQMSCTDLIGRMS